MLKPRSWAALLLLGTAVLPAAETNPGPTGPDWLSKPLSLAECIDLALTQNSTILKGKSDLEAAHGLVVQTRAIVIPKVRATGSYQVNDESAIDKFPISFPSTNGPAITINPGEQQWSAGVRVVQSIYEGGRMRSALRAAKLTKEQALLEYQRVVSDTLAEVRVAYYDVLLAAEQIGVQEASIKLLAKELEDTTRRYEAGTVPRFNVLRAEVELANARPRLIRTKNDHRLAKNNLVNLLGYNVPKEVWEDVPLQLTGKLDAEPYEIELPSAIAQAMSKRPELGVLGKAEQLRREELQNARAGYLPSAQVFAGYGSRNTQFSTDLSRDVSGWNAGAQFSWDIFDGLLTRGKVKQARSLQEKARYELADATRRIELEVRTAYSNFIEAKEVLESQKKVVEQAEEALRLANARADAGSGTQLDVLSAQTALTEARSTQVQALHDYDVARVRLERALGNSTPQLEQPR